MARIHVFECNSPIDGNVIVVHKSGVSTGARTGCAHTSLCDTGKEAMLTYMKLCDRGEPNEVSFQPPQAPEDKDAIPKDSTHVRNFSPDGIDLFKSLLSPVFVD